jgi:hypothetical protein
LPPRRKAPPVPKRLLCNRTSRPVRHLAEIEAAKSRFDERNKTD